MKIGTKNNLNIYLKLYQLWSYYTTIKLFHIIRHSQLNYYQLKPFCFTAFSNNLYIIFCDIKLGIVQHLKMDFFSFISIYSIFTIKRGAIGIYSLNFSHFEF